MNKRLETVLVIGLIIVSLLPIWQWADARIPWTHDLDLQIARIASFSQGLREGNIFPRWGGNLNWGYGHPSLMFLYPLSSYIGGILTLLGFSFVEATKLTFGLAAAAGALGMYLFLRQIFSVRAAVSGTFLYILAPYRLVDINVRGALGELAGLGVIPWVFWRFWELAVNPSRRNIGWAALSIFFLILAHNAVGLMGLGMLGMWLMVMFFYQSEKSANISLKSANIRLQKSQRGSDPVYPISSVVRFQPILADLSRLFSGTLFSLLLGFGLAGFYWIPGIIESKYTFQKEFTNFEIYASRFSTPKELLFSPWGYGGTPENGRLAGFTVSVGWANVISAAVLILFFAKRKNRHPDRSEACLPARQGSRRDSSLSFLVIFLIAIFFLTPLSLGVAKYLGIIQRFQFPWRFLAMTVVAGGVMGAAVIQAAEKRWIILTGFLGLVAAWQAFPGFFIQGYEGLNPANETFSGPVVWTTDTGESTPRWATRFQDGYPKSQLEVVWGADIDYQILERKSQWHRYLVKARVPTQVVDNTLYFPGWKVTVNGQEAPIEYQDQNWRGLITFPVPVGENEVEVEFTMTRVRKIAAAITLVSFAMLVALFQKTQKIPDVGSRISDIGKSET